MQETSLLSFWFSIVECVLMLKDTLYRKSRLDLQKYGLRQWIHGLAKQRACIYLELSLSYKTKQKCSFVHILFQLINLTNQRWLINYCQTVTLLVGNQ